MASEELSDSQIMLRKGLASDIFWCEIHYFIYRTVGENAVLVNELEDEYKKKQLGYLQSSAHDLVLIKLSHVFDRSSKKYKVRCLNTIIDECRKIDSVYFPLAIEYYPNLEKISKLTETKFQVDGFMICCARSMDP